MTDLYFNICITFHQVNLYCSLPPNGVCEKLQISKTFLKLYYFKQILIYLFEYKEDQGYG